jgi:glycosyltransferase involved in cell wall biosynthesis
VDHIVDHGYAHAAALLPKERVVASCHDLMLLRGEEGDAGFRGRPTSVLRFRWSTSFLRGVARVVVPTEATKRDVARLIGVDTERIDVVPYGIAPAFRPYSADRALSLRRAIVPDGCFAVLHVSTGNAYKNVEGVLKAIAALRAAGTRVTLVRAGKPLSREQQALAKTLGIGDTIIECGRVPEQRLVELYNACDVLLFPSHHEGYGWPPLEAMACGTPVVTSTCEALVEVTGSAALHARATDADALAAHVRRVLEDDELRERLRWAGIQRAGQYTWERTIDGFASAYAQVLSASGVRETGAVAA